MIWAIIVDMRQAPDANTWGVYSLSGLIVLYLIVGYLLLLYVVFGAYRFRFSDVGFRVFSWRGPQTFAWQQIRRAELSCYRYQVELVLFVGRFRRVTVPLTSFGKARSLFDAVRARISVPLVAAPQHLALLEDR
jgi:hypothetical protein